MAYRTSNLMALRMEMLKMKNRGRESAAQDRKKEGFKPIKRSLFTTEM
jgi:hypothetical protein